jgi:hypothetical protein
MLWRSFELYHQLERETMSKTDMLSGTMPDLREAVTKELERRGWSVYRLVQSLKGKRPDGKDVPPATIYEFCRGETAINSDDLGIIFEVLELSVGAPSDDKPQGKKGRK